MRKAIKAFEHEAGAVLLFALALCASSALGAEAQKGVTKGEYLDLMEAAVGAYSDAHLAQYLADVEKNLPGCGLPDEVDKNFVNDLLVRCRLEYYTLYAPF